MKHEKIFALAGNLFKRWGIIKVKEAMKVLTFFVFLFASSIAWAQRPAAPTEKVELLPGSDSLVIFNENGLEIRRVVNNVRFRHQGSILYCDLAIHNVSTNLIEAYGNVKIVQGDTITVTGDTLFYYGNTRLAIMSGRRAVLKDSKSTLTSRRLEYDMAGGIARYPFPGRTVDKENVLTSKEGIYDTRTKIFTYYRDVKLVNQKYTLTTDTLVYNSLTKWSYFNGATKIVNKDGTIVAKRGRYNTETSESIFDNRTSVENESYTLTGDSLSYDGQRGFARGDVEILDKKDNTLLTGDVGLYRKEEGFSKVYGHAVVRSIVTEDTLFIRADTLYRFENQLDSTQRLIGNKNVYIFKSDFQGKCDSIVYNTQDSTVLFFRNPILWSDNNQMQADTISAFLVNNKLNRMLLRSNSFVISEDTLVRQHNQVKGRTINALFDTTSSLRQVLVDGNGQSAYYAIGDDLNLIGLNRVECAKMNLQFLQNRVKRIAFIGRPEGKLIPPQFITSAQRQLEGFNWRVTEKPTRAQVTWQEEVPPPEPKEKKEASKETAKARLAPSQIIR
ncbi:OstA-like protein [Rhabdobacter roseus]|uniref:Lipopolysaccharide export system protein LptA n=1 Tax=Rhabdobacter roseus TaxID=1655419 RepID=A0A840TIH0_9BACT|nr:OstA-like protein [Rhabdobacter roseus]MBB5283966.1 lipopolysaccharide export system protein LptA [Rhabdobacter roseus]